MDNYEKSVIMDKIAPYAKRLDKECKLIQGDNDRYCVCVFYINSRNCVLSNDFFKALNDICDTHKIRYSLTTFDLTAVAIYYKFIIYTF